MTRGRVAPLASAIWIGLNVSALAQMMPGGPGPNPMMMMPGQMPPQQQQNPPCMGEFIPIRQDAEKRAHAIQEAMKRKVPPQELCGLFTSFSDAEGRVVKFIESNARSCGIPQEVLTITKSNHGKTLERKQQVCAAAQFGERRGPGLGEALGMRAVPTPDTTSNGKGGPFDTLSGSPLAK
ncbi:MAG TPA: hypothetical protein VEK55_00200 [Xanthobacteraceae bacterium]|nr:hypothetical protein [Xanthobacteraceae bacterium]